MGQTLLVVGALMLIGAVNLTVNRGFYSSGQVVQNSKIGIIAVSRASALVEEASSKKFDENTIESVVTSTTGLTASTLFGPNTGESYKTFDDVDDYNNLVRYDTTYVGEELKNVVLVTRCKVDYVDPTTPNKVSSSATWHKRLTISITSPAMTDSVVMSYVYSYWFF